MNNVIAFKARTRRDKSAPGGACQILFFTGVRYQREEGPKAVKPRKAPRSPRKKRA